MSGDRNGEYGEFPKDFLGKKKRSTGQKVGIGCGAVLVGFVVLGAIGAIVGDPKADGDRTQSATGNSAGPVASANTSSDAAAKAELQGQVKALWQSVIAQSTRCDEAANRVAAAGKTGDMYTIYPAANDGNEVCMDAKNETDKLDPPEAAEGDVEDAFEKAIEECGAGHGMRALAFQQLAAIADGDARPSKLTEVKETMEIAGRANLTCVASFYEAVGKAKLDQKVLDLK